jgi:molybdate transport system ATP-binding protein
VSAPIRVEVRKRLGAFQLDAAFEAAPEGITAVFGPSGAGKSQLLAAIAGASRPEAGRITLGETVLFDSAQWVDTPMERRRVGWVFQDGRLFPHLSVAANLAYGARRAGGRDAGVKRDELLAALGIDALLERAPASLSGGERQRVAIGRALLSQPALLLMDEPLAALDLPRRAEILPYLERLKTLYRLPILYVTHALSEVVRLADRLVVLEAGRVSAQGPLREVLIRDDLPILAARPDAATPYDAVVLAHDTARRLSRIDLGGAALLTPPLPLPVGARTRAAVLARDVLLARVRPQGLSARNVLPATVEAVGPARPDGVRLVRVRLEGGAPLQAALTGDAVEALELQPGAAVFAIVKSVAVEGVSPGGLVAALEL